jgi:hypothetical protein
LSIQAATDESTPPDIPTTTLDGLEAGVAEELRWDIKKMREFNISQKPHCRSLALYLRDLEQNPTNGGRDK